MRVTRVLRSHLGDIDLQQEEPVALGLQSPGRVVLERIFLLRDRLHRVLTISRRIWTLRTDYLTSSKARTRTTTYRVTEDSSMDAASGMMKVDKLRRDQTLLLEGEDSTSSVTARAR